MRRIWNVKSQQSSDVDRALSALANIGLPTTRENLARNLPDDKFTKELIVMAEARAYIQVAYNMLLRLKVSIKQLSLSFAFPLKSRRSGLKSRVTRNRGSRSHVRANFRWS